ncbi:MAG: integrase [Candidatus Kapaibacterium sp.]|nr:MAG: integrase [Candidatus Kapabacteria bacterium]
MPKPRVNRLTDAALRGLKPRADRSYSVYDGNGLYAVVMPTGRIFWRVRIVVRRKDCYINTYLALGEYPVVSLKDAREEAARVLHSYRYPQAAGISGLRARQTFAAVVQEWLNTVAKRYDPDYLRTIEQRLKRYVLPRVGRLPIASVTTATFYELLLPIATRVPETAQRIKVILSAIMRYAVARKLAERDVTAELRGQLPTAKHEHYPAPTDPAEIGAILRALWSYEGTPQVTVALRLLPYLFVRNGELRSMRWRDIDFDAGLWSFTASKTKTPHVVPLPRQAIELLQTLPRYSEFVFPSPRTLKRPLSEAALNAAYHALGLSGRIVPHSWRAIARTVLQEVLKYPPHVIELQLAHTVREPLGRAYNRTEFLEERREMMQTYADWLDQQRSTLEKQYE